MQRNRADQNPLIWLFFAVLFVPYEALSMHYLYLPPLFGVLFFLYIRTLDTHNSFNFFIIVFLLIVAETAKGYLLLSMLFFYSISYFLLLPRIKSIVSCHLCLNGIIVFLAYVGYWAFTALIANMLALPLPQLDFRVIFYMMIEFFIVGLL